MEDLKGLVEGLDRIEKAIDRVITGKTKLRRILREALSLRDSLEDRLNEHCEGFCEKRYTHCNIERSNYTAKEYYSLECKIGNKLYSRIERQAKRIKKLREAL